jgi:general nucleoside transport system ATP-binding protein
MLQTRDGGQFALRIKDITKRFGELTANDAISIDLKQGEILGLLGENGAGKTTLMNILFGHYVADEGSIEAFGAPLPPGEPKAALRAGIGMVHQHFTLADNLTVRENIALATQPFWHFSNKNAEAAKRIIALGEEFELKVNPDAPVSSLSVGERQRVEILKALYRNVRILILDEPTAVLTPQESSALFDTLKRFVANGLSIIFISHKLNEILAACNRVVVLRGGRKVAERDVKGATREELAELMVGRATPTPKSQPLQPGKPALHLQSIFLKQGLQDISLIIRTHEIIGIAGVSGNGQTLLAGIVAGTLAPTSGTVSLNGEQIHQASPRLMIAQGVARIPEDRNAEGIIADMTIAENAIIERLRSHGFARAGFLNWAKTRDFSRRIIESYAVKCQGPDARAGSLSGGNMQKLILGRVMAMKPKIILANQPTRGLDVGAVAYVHERLLDARAGGAGILLISEDLDELLSLSDSICVMYRGKLSTPMPRSQVSVQQLGLMMAGQGLRDAA